jgi:hypothetical protein
MNGGSLRWLFGLESSAEQVERARLVFERPMPGWAWFLALLACLGLSWWTYRRLRGALGGRVALGSLRAALLILLTILLSGPALRIAHETVEEDWVIVLADRSRSMSIRDAVERADGQRVTRNRQLELAVAGAEDTWTRIAADRTLLWLGFTGGAFDLMPGERSESGLAASQVIASGQPDGLGDRTSIDEAIRQALDRAAARPLSGIVLLSDGRTTAPPSRATLRRLQASAAKVFVVPLGSAKPAGDLAIANVEVPRRAFVRDELPVQVEIERSGEVSIEGANVRLVDTANGRELARATVPPFGEDEQSMTLVLLPGSEDPGLREWKIELDPGEGDLVAENNQRFAQVEFVDRPLRVLYVDGYPRWEYRYLKNLLIREPTIESSILLLSADRDFAQEGNMPITRVPRTREEFAQFDLVIIGDVQSGFFTPEQLELLRDQVAQRGSGVLWIGGERSTPKTWESTALADLLPMRSPLSLSAVEAPVNLSATSAATRLGLLKLGGGATWPEELSDPKVGWSRLEWAQAIPSEQLKPTAETLAVGVQIGDGENGQRRAWPLILSMKFGAGEIIYVATDEIWRWRYGRGERYTEQVWLPLIRMLGREALAGGGAAATLRAVPARVEFGQSVRLELVIDDARLVDRGDAAVTAEIRALNEAGEAGDSLGEVELLRTPRAGEFAATWSPEGVGRFTVRVPSGPAGGAEATFECERPDEETRRASADHALLEELARSTGGAILAPDQLKTLPDLLPKRSVVTEHATLEPIWDAPISLILIVLLATVEWLGRRWLRLA